MEEEQLFKMQYLLARQSILNVLWFYFAVTET